MQLTVRLFGVLGRTTLGKVRTGGTVGDHRSSAWTSDTSLS